MDSSWASMKNIMDRVPVYKIRKVFLVQVLLQSKAVLLWYHITSYQISITYQGSVLHFGVVWFRYSNRSESAYLLKWAKMFTKLLTRRAFIHTNQILLSRNRLKLSLWSFTHVFWKIETSMSLRNCTSKGALFSTNNGWTSRLSSFYNISNHK